MEEMQMPLFLQTQNNTGSCWLVINEVSDASLVLCGLPPLACRRAPRYLIRF